MICISINQESRRLAIVDMFNAAKQCDLVELRLDRFGMAPDLGEFIQLKPKPIIMSCRRPQDGGHWDGSEAERLALLRQCIVSKADFVEIELDVADQVRRFGPSQRVISYAVQPDDTAADIAARYEAAQKKTPDVIKFITPARTPEEAWPLVQILGKPQVPTVVVGLGKPGLMLTVLGKKIGAPWTYAALERGMEAYLDQPTVHDLRTVYRYEDIERSTRLIGVTGFGQRQYAQVAALNAGLAHLQLPARCLPMGVGSSRLFSKVMQAVKLGGVLIDAEHRETIREIADELHPTAVYANAVDLLLPKGDKWHGYYTGPLAALESLQTTLKIKSAAEEPLRNRVVMLVGLSAATRTLAVEMQRRGAGVILASHDRKAAQQMAQEAGCRHVQFEALYSTLHDVLILCQQESQAPVHPGYLRENMTVMDLTADVRRSSLLIEAKARGCHIVEPLHLVLDQLALVLKMLGGKAVARDILAAALPENIIEEQ